MFAEEGADEVLWERGPTRFHEMIDSGRLSVQDLYGEETAPRSHKDFDASLEAILHLITSVGYAQTYPGVFA